MNINNVFENLVNMGSDPLLEPETLVLEVYRADLTKEQIKALQARLKINTLLTIDRVGVDTFEKVKLKELLENKFKEKKTALDKLINYKKDLGKVGISA